MNSRQTLDKIKEPPVDNETLLNLKRQKQSSDPCSKMELSAAAADSDASVCSFHSRVELFMNSHHQGLVFNTLQIRRAMWLNIAKNVLNRRQISTPPTQSNKNLVDFL